MVFRLKLTYSEIEYILDMKFFFEISDLLLMLKSSLLNEVIVNNH